MDDSRVSLYYRLLESDSRNVHGSQFGTGRHWLHLIQRTNTDSIILGQYFVSSLVQQRLKYCLGHEAKKRLHAEEAPTNCGSRGQLLDYRVIFQGSIESFENSS
uniref:Uncharacterized protein n=1 Tax=Vespula pensylvanica TaxID=30213 RepID=A0A834NLV8_VESPE|nr:hypothetical protein H0235_012819 [Vespula pensylvanica]